LPDDAVAVARQLRREDRDEIAAVVATRPEEAIRGTIKRSSPAYAVAGAAAGAVFALFGVVPGADSSQIGQIWLVGTEEMPQYWWEVARQSRLWVDRLQTSYSVLWNCVDARNVRTIRWLTWCGFRIVERIDEYGVAGLPFYEFRRWPSCES